MRKKKVVIYLFYNDSTSSVVFQEEYFINIRYVIYISIHMIMMNDAIWWQQSFLNLAVSSHLQVVGVQFW